MFVCLSSEREWVRERENKINNVRYFCVEGNEEAHDEEQYAKG